MIISPIKYNHISYNRILPRYNPSFGSNSFENNTNKNTEKAVEISKKIFEEMDIATFNSQRLSEIVDVGIEEISNNMFNSSTAAYIKFGYNVYSGETIMPPKIHIPPLESSNKMAKTIYVMNFAHELTHKYQMDETLNPLPQIVEDIRKAYFPLRDVSNHILNTAEYYREDLEGEKMRQVMMNVLGQEGADSYKETGGLVLTNAVVENTKIVNTFGYKTEKEFISNFVKDNIEFDNMVDFICQRSLELRKKCVLSPTQTKKKIKVIMTKYYRNCVRTEKEASLTEYKVAKSQGYNDKSSLCTYKYFLLLEKAFDDYLQKII